MDRQINLSVITSIYRGEEYLEEYFKHVNRIINLKEVEFIFIHNDPLKSEKEIIFHNLSHNDDISYQYIEVPRELLYKSWNRAIKIAKGEYIAVWNIDDIRFPDSLFNQKKCLVQNPDASLAYGDKYILSSKEDQSPRLSKVKIIINNSWFSKFQDGSLIMWKKSLHTQIGYFDEQFISLGDQDFWYRVVRNFSVVRCNFIIGSFLAEKGKGISKSSKIPAIEKIIIGLRYGFFTYINLFGWRRALNNYDVNYLYYNNQRNRVSILDYKYIMIYFYSIRTIIFSIFK